MTSNHTPTPYNEDYQNQSDIVNGERRVIAAVYDGKSRPFIVNACNSHADLLKALKMALFFIETKEAVRGKALNAEEWKQAVKDFQNNGVSEIGIGRGYTDEATIDFEFCRRVIKNAESVK